MRTTAKKLKGHVNRLNKELNLPPNHAYSLDCNPSYGGYRLERKNGSIDISERLSVGEMRQYLLGMLEGVSWILSSTFV